MLNIKIYYILLALSLAISVLSSSVADAQQYSSPRLDTLEYFKMEELRGKNLDFTIITDSMRAYDNYYRRIRDRLAILPRDFQKDTLTESDKEKIRVFVRREYLRYLVDLHPAFLPLDDMSKKMIISVPKHYNPLEALYPQTKGYIYRPKIIVRLPKTDHHFITNIYEVELQHRFYKSGDCYGQKVIIDSIYRNRNFFVVYCVPSVNEMRMIGGPAFLQQLPWEAGESSVILRIMAYARTIDTFHERNQDHIRGMEKRNFYNYYYYRDTTARDTTVQNTTKPTYGMYGEACDPEQRSRGPLYALFDVWLGSSSREWDTGALVKVPVTCIEGVWQDPEIMHGVRLRTGGFIIQPEGIDRVQMVYYCGKSPDLIPIKGLFEIPYEKGFPYYEISQTFYNTPLKYEDTLIKIRGVKEDEMSGLRKNPIFHNVIFAK
jgi:hypothetical protein